MESDRDKLKCLIAAKFAQIASLDQQDILNGASTVEKEKAWTVIVKKILQVCHDGLSEEATLDQIMSHLENVGELLQRDREDIESWGRKVQDHWKKGEWVLSKWESTQGTKDNWSKRMFQVFRR